MLDDWNLNENTAAVGALAAAVITLWRLVFKHVRRLEDHVDRCDRRVDELTRLVARLRNPRA